MVRTDGSVRGRVRGAVKHSAAGEEELRRNVEVGPPQVVVPSVPRLRLK